MVRPFLYAVIDDETAAIDVIKILMKNQNGFICAKSWTDPELALREFPKNMPDLLFLDIDMPSMTGLEFLSRLELKPITILVTAYPEFALEAFSHGVRDYILKPVSEERVIASLANIRPLLLQTQKNSGDFESLSFKYGHEKVFINPNSIIKIEAEGNFSKFILDNGADRIISETLRELTFRLSGFGFIRIHKSVLINAKHIVSHGSSYLKLSDNSKNSIGRTYQDNIKKVMMYQAALK